ncbi:MAG: ribbon-helix-helix domain-containing protein [Tagaea sp.]
MAARRSNRQPARPSRKPGKKRRKGLSTTNRPRTFRVSEDRRTSVRLEPSFWNALRDAAEFEGQSPAEWAQKRGVFDRPRARSSALRVALLEYFVFRAGKSAIKRPDQRAAA